MQQFYHLMKKDAITISLRKRVIPSGKTTLYIEYYFKPIADVEEKLKGKRIYEPLSLFLLPNEGEKNNNKLQMADITLMERKSMVGKHPFDAALLKGFCITDFIAWLYSDKCSITLPYGKVMFSNTLSALRAFSSFNITFESITQDFVDKFSGFLASTGRRTRFGEITSSNNKRKPSTIKSYLKTLLWVLKCATNEGLYKQPIPEFTFPRFSNEQPDDTNSIYLTSQELNAVSKVEDGSSKILKAFLFACLTGVSITELRVICNLDISNHSMTFVSKTRGKITLPISKVAQSFLYRTVDSMDAPIFDLPGDLVLIRELSIIFHKAGIAKKPTNSMPRHTFVMNLLDEGVPIQDISRLLGYKLISSMQLYVDLHGYKTDQLAETITTKNHI